MHQKAQMRYKDTSTYPTFYLSKKQSMNKKIIYIARTNIQFYIAVLVSVLFLSSCTMKSIYNQLDWIVPQYIEKYIPLTDIQEQQLKTNLARTLNWHRKNQLPHYINWLKSFRIDINKGLNQERVNHHSMQLQTFFKEILKQFAHDLSVLLLSTTQQQQIDMFTAFEENNIEYSEKYVIPDAAVVRQLLNEQIADRFEFWLGGLNTQQEKLFTLSSNKLQLTGELRLNNQLKWQNRLKTILDTNNSLEKLKPAITNLLINAEELREKEYQEMLDFNQSTMTMLIVDISKTLDKEQKLFLLDKLKHYIEVFNELSIK